MSSSFHQSERFLGNSSTLQEMETAALVPRLQTVGPVTEGHVFLSEPRRHGNQALYFTQQWSLNRLLFCYMKTQPFKDSLKFKSSFK